MPFRAAIVCALLAGILADATAAEAAADQASSSAGSVVAGLWQILGQALAMLRAWLTEAYGRAPALVAVLVALLVAPAAALFGLLVESLRRWRLAGKERTHRADMPRPAAHRSQAADVTPWPARAWLRVDGRTDGVQALAGPLVRIGRHEDNDILLASPSVHRHHAVIHQTADTGFVITDMSGDDGNGVLVNGERLRQSRLYNGDLIVLGEARLTFESAPL